MIAEKGLVCEERDVSLPQSEHKEPWFMRLNLGEEVPVIIHRDNIISDYDQIIDYVERTFTGGTVAAPPTHPHPRSSRAQSPGKPGESSGAVGKAQSVPKGATGYRQASGAPQELHSLRSPGTPQPPRPLGTPGKGMVHTAPPRVELWDYSFLFQEL